MMNGEYLEHHGTVGMHWGERNGPPYPLTGWQQKAGDAVAKGKEALRSALNDYTTKAKASYDAKTAARKAKAEEMENRKQEAARREKLIKLAKKHPELLTDKELDELNNRKQKENNFKKNYVEKQKKGNEEVKKLKDNLINDVIKPTTVEVGKAAILSMLGKGNFEDLAKERLTKALNNPEQWKSQNQGESKKEKKKSDKEKDKQKKKPKLINITINGQGKKK